MERILSSKTSLHMSNDLGRTPYLREMPLLRWDYSLGLRGWGLLLYGALPATLAAVGVLRPPELKPLTTNLLFPIIVVSLPPLVTLWLLVRQRLRAWYLTSARLSLRSLVVTALILLLSSAITGETYILKGRYSYLPLRLWLHVDEWVLPVCESLLLAVAFLVGSSTLLLVAVKEDAGLPALPSKRWAENVACLRQEVGLALSSANDWNHSGGVNSQTILAHVTSATEALSQLFRERPPLAPGIKQLLNRLKEDLGLLTEAVEDVNTINANWVNYFSESTPVGLNPAESERRNAIERLASLG